MSNKRQPRNPDLNEGGSKSTPWVIAAVILVCVAAIVTVALVMGGDDGEEPAAGDEPSEVVPSESGPDPSTPTSSSTRGPGEPTIDCTEPPAAPPDPEQFDAPPDPATAEGKTFVATLETNCGPIVLELDGSKAPQTVASFIFLAQEGYYDDSPCHRLVVSGIYVLQCGDPTGQGSGGPGYGYGIENAPADGNYPRGTLAMARTSDPESNGSQFFMVYADTQLPTDGGGYSVFGKVTDGFYLLETVADIGVAGGGTDGAPNQPVSILSIDIEEK